MKETRVLSIELINALPANIGTSNRAKGTIIDKDILPQLYITTGNINEGSSAAYKVSTNGTIISNPILFEWNLIYDNLATDDVAANNDDFIKYRGNDIIRSGDSSTTIRLKARNNTIYEEVESFRIVIKNEDEIVAISGINRISTIVNISIAGIKVSSTDVRVGEKITISAEVKNIGLEDASTTTIQFYRSIDSTISTADLLLNSVSVADIITGKSINVETATISKLGRFYYGLCVKQINLEQNIINNCSHGISVNSQLSWQQATASADWSARNSHTSLVYDNKMWVLGGSDGSYKK